MMPSLPQTDRSSNVIQRKGGYGGRASASYRRNHQSLDVLAQRTLASRPAPLSPKPVSIQSRHHTISDRPMKRKRCAPSADPSYPTTALPSARLTNITTDALRAWWRGIVAAPVFGKAGDDEMMTGIPSIMSDRHPGGCTKRASRTTI